MRLALPGSFGWMPGAAATANPHSRRVARLKLILPGIGLGLLLMIAIWPRLAPVLERMRMAVPAIDLRDARELRMLNPRYVGTDRQNRPFVVTAAVGRQSPDHQDLMSLDAPRAEMRLHTGVNAVVNADIGMYQAQAQMLDLSGHVVLTHDNGTQFTTQSARVDIAGNTATGHDFVEGHGPSGTVKGQGFEIRDRGDTIIFDGDSDAVLTGAKSAPSVSAQPPALPASVVATAARVEAEQRASAGVQPRAGNAVEPVKRGAAAAKAHPAVAKGANKPVAHAAAARTHGKTGSNKTSAKAAAKPATKKPS